MSSQTEESDNSEEEQSKEVQQSLNTLVAPLILCFDDL